MARGVQLIIEALMDEPKMGSLPYTVKFRNSREAVQFRNRFYRWRAAAKADLMPDSQLYRRLLVAEGLTISQRGTTLVFDDVNKRAKSVPL